MINARFLKGYQTPSPDLIACMSVLESPVPMESLCPVRLNSAVKPDRLLLKPLAAPRQFEILDAQTHQTLGTVTVPEHNGPEIELFWGKGGFMGLLSSSLGPRYFALPGSSVAVQGVELKLVGEPLTGTPGKPEAHPTATTQPQAHATQATILGAGLATRFERISGDSTQYSKPAVPLAGPLSVIECIAAGLLRHGFTDLIVNTYFKPESLKAGLAKNSACQVRYIDESEPSGTAGGLRKMLCDPQYAHLLDLTRPLLVVQGDSVTDADFSALMEAHIARRALLTIGCQWVDESDVDKFGIIVTDQSGADGQSGRITEFQEKPRREEARSQLGNTGFYLFSPASYPLVKAIYAERLTEARQQAEAAGEPLPQEAPFDFATDIFPAILRHAAEHPELGDFWAQSVAGYWSDIGNPAQYVTTVHDIYAGKVHLPLPATLQDYYRDGVIFWEGAAALADREGAQLSGNVVVALPFKPPGA